MSRITSGFTGDGKQKCKPPRFLQREVRFGQQVLSGVVPDSSHVVAPSINRLQQQTGQKLDKSPVPSILLMLLIAPLGMAVEDFFNQRAESYQDARRDAQETIERLLREFGDRIAPSNGRSVAAAYIRYSTSLQDSFESQLRAILTEAAAKSFSVTKENIFYDLGISGARRDREGLAEIREARAAGRFEVFVALATSRLARNLKTLLEVLDEEFVGNGTRCILVDQRLDSKDIERWRLLLPLLGWLDEIQRTNQAGYVRAAHRMLLARRIAYSTTTYGYGGEVIAGFFTKRGRPVSLMIVDEVAADVVKLIFAKFNQGVSINRIAKQLNANPELPRPPKSNRNLFSRDFVRRVLESPAYAGVFVYANETDVSTLPPLQMRELAMTDGNVFSFPELQIVSDDEYLAARARLRGNVEKHGKALRSPRSKESNRSDRPMLLNGFLVCPECGNKLVATGPNGTCYGCKTCKYKPVEQQFLYSYMSRRLCTDLVIDAICGEVLSSEEIVSQAIAGFLESVETMRTPDPGRLAELQKQRTPLTGRLEMVIDTFTGQDANLVQDKLQEIRGQLARLDSEIARERRIVDQVVSIPSEEEARLALSRFSEVLKEVSSGSSDDELDKARELIALLTGGRIEVYQCGRKKPKAGWLQLRFRVCIAAALGDQVDVGEWNDSNSIELVIDVKEEPKVNPKIAKARELYDLDYFENEIATELQAGRASVCKWIRQSFEEQGVDKPDGYARRKRIEQARGLHHYQQISDEVFELAESGILLGEIAKRLNINRDVVTDSLRYAREKRGLPPLDGRTRRKSLDSKSR